MITAGLMIFGGLLFVLGVIAGSMGKDEKCPRQECKLRQESVPDKEMLNFLNYDGSKQE